MPENEETEQVETEPQEAETALEAAGSEEEPFDRKRAEAALKKKNSEAENLRKRLKELEPLAKRAKDLEDAQKSEQERLTEQLTVAEQRAQAYQQRAVRAEVRALAAVEFADPDDAHAFLDLDSFVNDDGDIDADGIQQGLKDLLKRKPHLAKPVDSSPRAPKADRTQGSSGNGNRTPNDPGEEFASFLNRSLTRGR
jgi:DNA repair exonuclease SbcCD ATPase subunit